MPSIEELRKSLPGVEKKYTNEEMLQIRETLYGLADICLEKYFSELKEKRMKQDNQFLNDGQ